MPAPLRARRAPRDRLRAASSSSTSNAGSAVSHSTSVGLGAEALRWRGHRPATPAHARGCRGRRSPARRCRRSRRGGSRRRGARRSHRRRQQAAATGSSAPSLSALTTRLFTSSSSQQPVRCGQLVEELGLGQRVVGPAQVGRQVLDADRPRAGAPARAARWRPSGRGWRAVKAIGSRSLACSGARAGAARRAREAGVVGDAHRLDALHQRGQPVEVPGVEPDRRAERQADAVQAHRVVRARRCQQRQRRAAVGEEVLRVHLDEGQRRAVPRADARSWAWRQPMPVRRRLRRTSASARRR